MFRLVAIGLLATMCGCASPEFWQGVSRGMAQSKAANEASMLAQQQQANRDFQQFQESSHAEFEKNRRLLEASQKQMAQQLKIPEASQEWVNGHYRNDGAFVNGHYRTVANTTMFDNWSIVGNVNPYTGVPGTISPF